MFSAVQKAVTITFFRNASISHIKQSQGRLLQRLASSHAAQHIVPPSPSPLPVTVHHSLLPVRMPVAPPVVPLPLRLPPLVPPIRPPPESPAPTPAQPPTPSGDSGRREAARLIVIRRRKMRKHKLKKLRKRMRYVWAKVKLRRSIRREKAFQAEQMAMIADARRFDPRQYVQEIIEKSSTLPMATVRHGKRLPYFIRLELEKDNLIKQPK